MQEATPQPVSDLDASGKSFGQLLREERVERGLSLEDVVETTRIRKHHLEALERDDFTALPGDVFVKGYLRAYAAFLGVEADLMIADYDRQRTRSAQDGDRVIEEMSRVLRVDEAARRRRRQGLAAGVGVLVVAAAGIAVWQFAGSTNARVDREQLPAEVDTGVIETATASSPAPQVVPAAPAIPPEDKAPEETGTAPTQTQPATPQGTTATLASSSGEDSPPERHASRDDAPRSITERNSASQTNSATQPSSTRRPGSDETIAATALRVPDFGVGSDVVDRQLVGPSDAFPAGSRVVFWTRVLDGAPGSSIDHIWLRDGVVVGRKQLRIGGSHWRTHSARLLPAEDQADWSVEARDADGKLLARSRFRVY